MLKLYVDGIRTPWNMFFGKCEGHEYRRPGNWAHHHLPHWQMRGWCMTTFSYSTETFLSSQSCNKCCFTTTSWMEWGKGGFMGTIYRWQKNLKKYENIRLIFNFCKPSFHLYVNGILPVYQREMEMVTQLLVKVAECWEIHSVHHIYSSSFAHLEMIIWSVEFHKSSKSLTFKVWNLVSISEANCCSSQFVNIIQTQQVIAKCYWLVGAPTISANGQLHKRKTTLTPSIMSCGFDAVSGWI